MRIESNIVVKSKHHNKPIVTDVFYESNNVKKPIVIFCHGYKGYKDWGAWNLAAKLFAENQLFFVKFNFSYNGGTYENPIDFPDLTAFSENNYTIELADLEDVINWIVKNDSYKNEVDTDNIILIGHSRGGGTVVIKAAENKLISSVITWNGVSDFASRFPKDKELNAWKDSGFIYVLNGRTNQQMPHKYQFYKDFKENEERLTVKNAVEKLNKPQLIISGEQDDVVLPLEGEKMHLWNPKSTKLLIKGMDHSLGSQHPWTADILPNSLEEAVRLSIGFIK